MRLTGIGVEPDMLYRPSMTRLAGQRRVGRVLQLAGGRRAVDGARADAFPWFLSSLPRLAPLAPLPLQLPALTFLAAAVSAPRALDHMPRLRRGSPREPQTN